MLCNASWSGTPKSTSMGNAPHHLTRQLHRPAPGTKTFLVYVTLMSSMIITISGATSGNRMYCPPEGRIVHTQSSAAPLGGHVTEQPYARYTICTCPISCQWALMDRRVLKRQMMGDAMNDHSISCPRKSRCSTLGMTSYHLRHTDILLKLVDASNIRMRMSSGKLSI